MKPAASRSWFLPFPGIVFVAWLASFVTILYAALAFSDHTLWHSGVFIKWDQGWYESIVAQGYHLTGGQSNVAFFPLYPLIVWIVSSALGLKATIAGVVVSLICFAAALQLTYRLAASRFDDATARATTILMAVFPFSFFFGLVYTESLFLLLLVGVLWWSHQKQWWLAALCAGLASATRSVGLVLAAVVVFELLRAARFRFTPRLIAAAVGYGLIGCSGLLAFMLYLQFKVHDALAFIHVQKYWPGRGNGLSGLRTDGRIFHIHQLFSNPYALNVVELLSLALFLALTIYCLRYINVAWGLLGLLSLLIPLATGSTISLNRYSIVLVPAFLSLGYLLRRSPFAPLIMGYSAALFGFFFALFITTAVFIG